MSDVQIEVDGVPYTLSQVADQIRILHELLPLVTKTCGQSNCNCIGSNHIKQLVRDLGITTSVQRGAR